MENHVRRALAHSGIIDITTTGRRTAEQRRIEIVYHVVDGRIYISGMPSRRKRAWIANLESDARMTFHLKGTIAADLPARGRVITDEAERRRVLPAIAAAWRRTDIEEMVRHSPLIEVTIDDVAA